MNILKQVLHNEVYPALGCTEPISCAYAAAAAARVLGEQVETLRLVVDPGTFKNGNSVTVPHSGSRRGNLIAAAMGACLANPGKKLELLADANDETLDRAVAMIDTQKATVKCNSDVSEFQVEIEVAGAEHSARCLLAEGHTHIVAMSRDGVSIDPSSLLLLNIATPACDGGEHETGESVSDQIAQPVAKVQTAAQVSVHKGPGYRDVLRCYDLVSLLRSVELLDDEDRQWLRRGIEMNLAAAERGMDSGNTALQLKSILQRGFLAEDMFYRVKLRVAAAVDARMAGFDVPVMTSGGSGNQGIVAILTTALVGREMGLDDETIIRGVAVAHLINAYVKCFIGELSVICGCAMAAGVAAAAAIVYMNFGIDRTRITLAINNVVGDLGGLICDGAKPGCAMKTVTAVDAAMRAGLMAMGDYGLSSIDGLVGETAEQSIRNLGRVTLEGMFQVDPTLLNILQEKSLPGGNA